VIYRSPILILFYFYKCVGVTVSVATRGYCLGRLSEPTFSYFLDTAHQAKSVSNIYIYFINLSATFQQLQWNKHLISHSTQLKFIDKR